VWAWGSGGIPAVPVKKYYANNDPERTHGEKRGHKGRGYNGGYLENVL